MKKTTGSYELTEDEKAAALKEAQEKKERLVKYEEEQERRRQWAEALMRPWSHTEVMEWVRWRAKKLQDAGKMRKQFQVDEHNHAAIKALCMYFAGDKEFEKIDSGFSLEKGIMLRGPVGTGKSTLMALFCANQRRSFRTVSCRDVADQFKKHGEEILHIWSNPIVVPSHQDTFFQRDIGTCFDDMGTEGVKRHFGDQVNVMTDILLNRHDRGATPSNYTHVTTNLTADEIEQYYGTRVRSRCREMFNTLVLTGPDRRI